MEVRTGIAFVVFPRPKARIVVRYFEMDITNTLRKGLFRILGNT